MTSGVYIHIPFCHSKCNYCHFVSMPLRGSDAGRYLRAVISEISAFAESTADIGTVDSLYFGGGTPSLVPATHISDLLATCRERFQISSECEISLEANPGTVSAQKLKVFQKAGINRISLGAQSFADHELVSIGRIHDSDTITKSLSQLRAYGFSNINLDLMMGLPDQTRATWMRNLEIAAVLAVPHLSVYMLDLDDRCALYSMVEKGYVRVPDDDLISDLYLETIGFLSRHGYAHYEISNFALPGFTCRHNLKYWRRDPVYGFGLGSHSFDGQFRYANFPEISEYFRAVESGATPVDWREAVSSAQSLAETLFLGLRLTQGINWEQLQDVYGSERLTPYEDALRDLSKKGLAEWTDSIVRLTPTGMLVSNEIFQTFI